MSQSRDGDLSLSERLRAPGANGRGTLAVTLTFCDRRALLLIVGELDRLEIGQLEARVNEALSLGAERLVVDLSPTRFIDGFGLLTLASAADALARPGGVTLVGTTAVHRRLLDLLGIADRFTLV